MNKETIKTFEIFQKQRIQFVQKVAELANRDRNINDLKNLGAMDILRSLLLDTVPGVQQSASLALGRMAQYSEELAEAVVTGEILPQIVYTLSEKNTYLKKSAAFVISSVAKHSPELAQAVVDSLAVESLVKCLEEFDPRVKEQASWAIGNIASHNAEMAQCVVSEGAVERLVLCIQEPEINLERSACYALSNICKHSAELAQAAVDANAIQNLTPLLSRPDKLLKRKVCQCLSHIAKHSVELAELVVEQQIFPKVFILLKDSDTIVRKNSCTLIRDVCRHTPELSALVVKSGGLMALVDYTNTIKGNYKLPGIMTLGYISTFSEALATQIIKQKGVTPLGYALVSQNSSNHVKAAAAWALGQCGKHSSTHAKLVANANILTKLMDVYLSEKSDDDLKSKAKKSLKNIIEKCDYLEALDPLLHENAPKSILKSVVMQYAKVLPTNINEKKRFVTSKGIRKLQRIKAQTGTPLQNAIDAINKSYPPEVVRYYSPGYDKVLLNKIDGN